MAVCRGLLFSASVMYRERLSCEGDREGSWSVTEKMVWANRKKGGSISDRRNERQASARCTAFSSTAQCPQFPSFAFGIVISRDCVCVHLPGPVPIHCWTVSHGQGCGNHPANLTTLNNQVDKFSEATVGNFSHSLCYSCSV